MQQTNTKPIKNHSLVLTVVFYTFVILAFLYAVGAFAQTSVGAPSSGGSKWYLVLAQVALSFFEAWLGRTPKLQSGSTLELAYNAVTGKPL